MITTVLVANRGEIARRVFATCRRLGIGTVAVHSDADAGLPFVAEADSAVRLPGATPAETYLRTDLVLAAARAAGADAVHPGYGFLSENAAFARAVLDAGLTWIGPSPEAIEAMGSKVAAKKLMASAGVPVLGDLTTDTATEADLPLLVKASAGGGGRGMRVVRTLAELPGAIAAAQAEATSAFGDGTVFVEPYVEQGRHVEVQVLGTADGVLVLGERDCSLQRRHQKVVEEAPAPGLRDDVRTALHDAARLAAEAIDYRGAGTVEFLMDAASQRFFFLEMNTRLQVEHPVTEQVFATDLVELQLAVAEGSPLPPVPRVASGPVGHAIEVRLYAEDPGSDYQPQSGRLTAFAIPGVDVAFALGEATSGLRLDSGFGAGDEVGTHYDAMLAKVVAWAPTRTQAARRLAGALRSARLHGLVTNRDQLVRILEDPAFLGGAVSTAFLGERDWEVAADPARVRRAAVAATVALQETVRAARTVQTRVPIAWRNVPSQPQTTRFRAAGAGAGSAGGDGDEVAVAWWGGRDGYVVVPDAGPEDVNGTGSAEVVVAASPDAVVLEVGGVRRAYAVAVGAASPGAAARLDVDGPDGHVALTAVPRFVDPADAVASGSLLAPMPGTVVAVLAAPGDAVAAGDPVLVLEAMKMQHTVAAPHAGTVADLPVQAGQQVAAGEVLAVVEEASTSRTEPTAAVEAQP